jgi:molecular chaperone GrpE
MSGRPEHAAARWADDEEGRASGAHLAGADERPRGRETEAEPAGETEKAETKAVQNGSRAPQEARGLDAEERAEAAEEGAAEEGAAEEGAEEEEGARILTDVAALMAQRDEYLESLQRLKADFDNYRKRVARLQEEQSARAEANLVMKLLPVLDNLDLAWAHLGPREVQGEAATEEARAIGQARAQLLDILGKEGLERVDEVGVAFDPTVHDAVAQDAGPPEAPAPSEVEGSPEGASAHTIVVEEVMRSGYRWRGRVLRPAMVRVRG